MKRHQQSRATPFAENANWQPFRELQQKKNGCSYRDQRQQKYNPSFLLLLLLLGSFVIWKSCEKEVKKKRLKIPRYHRSSGRDRWQTEFMSVSNRARVYVRAVKAVCWVRFSVSYASSWASGGS